MITESLLLTVMPRAGANAAIYCEPLKIAAERFGINTPIALAAWLATIGHESLDLTAMEENMNYSAEGLARTWPSRFAEGRAPNVLAIKLARKPEAIANNVYANRMGNGPPESGDGWKYRGRGPLQCTGRDMYRRAGEATKYPLEDDPDIVKWPIVGALVAGWIFAVEKDCCSAADDILVVTHRINGGYVGMEDRRSRYARAKKALAA
jgi:putative chitinase